MNPQPTTTEQLEAELAAVTGELCGWTHADHAGGFTCLRAKDHAGARILTDVHVARVDGQLVTAAA